MPDEPLPPPPDPVSSKVTRARAKTVGAATPATRAVSARAPRPVMDPPTASTPDPGGEGPARDLTVAQGGITTAHAQRINLVQGGITTAQADGIDVHQGGIARATATDIAVSQGGIALARGDKVSLEMGGMLLAIAGEARVSQGFVRQVLARDVHVEQGAVVVTAANHVTVRSPAAVGVLIARRVEGDVRPLLDWRGAFAAGAAIALILGLLRRR